MSAAEANDPAKYGEFSQVVQQLACCEDNRLRTQVEASYHSLVESQPAFVIAALSRMICDANVSPGVC